MSEHLSIRCLHYQLLLPGGSVQSIRALAAEDILPRPINPASRSERLACPRLDLRKFLHPNDFHSPSPSAGIHWISEDGSQNIFLVVDAIDRIVHCLEEDLRPLPPLPKRLRTLCDALLRLPDGTAIVRLSSKASWPMLSTADKRHFLKALVRIRPEASEGIPS